MESKDSFIFSQTNLRSSWFSAFEDMKNNNELCDVTIKTQSSCSFPAHRVILAAGIPYFRAVFTRIRMAGKEVEISISELDPRALESLIHFAYSGEIQISAENVHSIILASQFLQLAAVQHACIEFLSKRLCVDNVPSTTYDVRQLPSTETSSSDVRGNIRELDPVAPDLKSAHNFPLKALVAPPEPPNEVCRTRFVTVDTFQNSICCQDTVEEAAKNNILPKAGTTLKHARSVQRNCGSVRNGIYTVCCCLTSGCSVNYYDFEREEWDNLTSCGSHDIVYHVAAVADKIYVFHSQTVEIFHLGTLEWEKLEPTHQYIGGAAMVSHGITIYCFGSRHVDFLDKVRCFNTELNKWQEGGKLKFGRSFCGVASLEEDIYLTGGYTAGWNHDIVEKYNPLTGDSCEVSSMLSTRSGHASVSAKEKIYVCGGWTTDFFCDAEMYDPLSDQWNFICPMTIPRGYFSLVLHDRKLYALGGLTSGFEFCLGVDIYDPENDQWKYSFCVPEGFPFAVPIAAVSD